MYIGMKNGDTRLGPFSISARQFSSKVATPPVPVPIKTPTRFTSTLSQLFARQASVIASSAAPIANWENKSYRRSSFLSRKRAGSKSFTSHANRTDDFTGSKRVIDPAPDRPATRASQVVRVVLPSGLTSPRPVMTTRRGTCYFPILSWRYFIACPTVRSFSASSSGMSMSNSFSKAMTSSTVSRLSAPRSSMKLASDVSFSRSTPSSSTMMSLTFSSSCFMSIAMVALNGGVGKRSQHHPAVDDQHLTRNVAGEVGGEKEHRRRDIRSLAQPAHRNGPDQGLARLAGDLPGQLRIDKPGRHGVHEYIPRGQLLRHRLGEADQAGLGGGIVGLALVARDADDARDVDDPAPATLDHPPGRVLGHQEGALQVRVEHGAPVVLVDPEQQVVPRRARVVHEDVDLAELPLDRADRGLDLSRVRDVARKAPRRGVPERARRLLGLGAEAEQAARSLG